MYNIPGYGNLSYCGIAGLYYLFLNIKNNCKERRGGEGRDHAVYKHLREGGWLPHYIADRISSRSGALSSLSTSLFQGFENIKRSSSSPIDPNRPIDQHGYDQSIGFQSDDQISQFEEMIEGIWRESESHSISFMSPFIQHRCSLGDDFVKSLALNSILFMSVIPSSPLLRQDNSRYLSPKSSFPSSSPSSFPSSSPATKIPLSSSPSSSSGKPGGGVPLGGRGRRRGGGGGGGEGEGVSLAAGLPHFSTGYMRNWGRDTFISMRGLLLTTGRWDEALHITLSFASCLRHGLIPNLLDGGVHPRYNARDATWWFLLNLKNLSHFFFSSYNDNNNNNNNDNVEEGRRMSYSGIKEFLTNTMVDRYFEPYSLHYSPSDDDSNIIGGEGKGEKKKYKQTSLAEIIQEIMEMHYRGIDFREFNAGPEIDDKMSDEGFNISIRVDRQTGFVYGGNRMNCGTWMDKMGSSNKAGNSGTPSTPRDGADVEIIALLHSSLSWLVELHTHHAFPFAGVSSHSRRGEGGRGGERRGGEEGRRGEGGEDYMSYADWLNRLTSSFEKHFYIPMKEEDDHLYHVNKQLINRRGIYKDVIGSSTEYSSYQLRPNMVIALSVVISLFPLLPF